MSSPRRPLHERKESQNNVPAQIRLVENTPPRLLGRIGPDDIYSRTPLPTHPSHFLGPGRGKGNVNVQGQGQGQGPALTLDDQFQRNTKAPTTTSFTGSPVTTTHESPQPPSRPSSATGSVSSKPKSVPKKRLHIHKDNKTFSLLQDDSAPVEEHPKSPTSLLSTSQKSSDSLPLDTSNGEDRTYSIDSCTSKASLPVNPATPVSQRQQPKAIADHIANSPWNYQLVGGLRKVPKTPDLKQKASTLSESSLPPLPEVSDGPLSPASHDLSTKPSFLSTETTTTTSENTNYKVYGDDSASVASASEVALSSPSPRGSTYPIDEDYSESSVIYRPHTAVTEDENENYEILGASSPAGSYFNLAHPGAYSQESLVVPPLNSTVRNRRSNETLGYYKSRSRESLRTGSLTSISTVLSQQEAFRAIVGTGSLIHLPAVVQKAQGSSSWAEPQSFHPPRSHMNEHPHQWSSQLSTVLSVSDGGTERNSRSWSSDNGRRSSGFPSTQSRHSRQMLSISSSVAQEEAYRARSESIEPPAPVFARNGQRHMSNSSIRMVEDQDEHGDGITDMQDLRTRPSRSRLSGFYSVTSSDNGRTNTMRSTASSRANSLLAQSIPTWAKLYYGSGERRYIGAPGSSTDVSESRNSSFRGSFREGSPNTDHFPLSIYSPRRRPRGTDAQGERASRGSLEINEVSQHGDNGRVIADPYSRRLRTWSMSSIWSPHLRQDRRAARRSAWEPPSVNWSTERGWFGRRNVQIVMFIMGFIFPFAWMIGALLPLPASPMRDMQERDNSTSNLDSSHDIPNDFSRQFGPMDEARYESAKWWRRLNRYMSIIGILVLAVIIILVVVGLKHRW